MIYILPLHSASLCPFISYVLPFLFAILKKINNFVEIRLNLSHGPIQIQQ